MIVDYSSSSEEEEQKAHSQQDQKQQLNIQPSIGGIAKNGLQNQKQQTTTPASAFQSLVNKSVAPQSQQTVAVPKTAAVSETSKSKLPDVSQLLNRVPSAFLQANARDRFVQKEDSDDEYETYNSVPPPSFSLKEDGDLLRAYEKKTAESNKRRSVQQSEAADDYEPHMQKYYRTEEEQEDQQEDPNLEIEEKKSTKPKKQSAKLLVPRQILNKKPNISTEQ